MNLVPTDPRTDRVLLADVLRWARTHGWSPRWPERRREHLWTWVNASWPYGGRPPEDATRVVLDGMTLRVERFKCRTGWRPTSTTWKPASVVEAVDVLVALGILPPLLSSAYGMAVGNYAEQVEALEEDLARAGHALTLAHKTIAGLQGENAELRQAVAGFALASREAA